MFSTEVSVRQKKNFQKQISATCEKQLEQINNKKTKQKKKK